MTGLQREAVSITASAPLRVRERHGVARSAADICIGVPLPKGWARDCGALTLRDGTGNLIPHQFRPLSGWPDGSLKWVLAEGVVSTAAYAENAVFVDTRTARDPAAAMAFAIDRDATHIDLRCANLHVRSDIGGDSLFGIHRAGGGQGVCNVSLTVTDKSGLTHTARVARIDLEHQGALSATFVLDGGFETRRQPSVEFRVRVTVHALLERIAIEVQLRNPQAAQHVGGLWDLGDRGSFYFNDCTVRLSGLREGSPLSWRTTPQAEPKEERGNWSLYQDSSAGERWNSINHVDANERLTVTFQGYAISRPDSDREIVAGRATPTAFVHMAETTVAVSPLRFWQEFPKALRRHGSDLEVGLFPRECQAGFELQGGEHKRHSVLVEFGSASVSAASCAHTPLDVTVDADWVESTGAIAYFVGRSTQSHGDYERYIDSIIDGADSFFAKRECVDEYGWRHFGDLYADHEAANHNGTEPFTSHYNNQYDFIYGAFVHFLRTGDERWRELMQDAARHTLDIDIYHTQSDKPAFNGGLFWHTDHHAPAATSTHRTYSRASASSAAYGGGPSNEHNYTSGLLHYHYLTGDVEAKAAVLELGDWVIAMDDGSRTLLSFVNGAPTGLASKTSDVTYHKAGRGGGNSVNALLDAYAISGQRTYLLKAEELIQRCIHPGDDVPALQLDEQAEIRWSYLVFLQVLGKYLSVKSELGEIDYAYQYARESLLHYARWMLGHEVPYKDVLHKVVIPTETWPAQDVRKAHVLYLAAKYAQGQGRNELHARAAFFFERCLTDVLSFTTAYLTRPRVLLCVYGYVHEYFQKRLAAEAESPSVHAYDFGRPVIFHSQRELLGSAISAKCGVLQREMRRLAREVKYRLAWKLGVKRAAARKST